MNYLPVAAGGALGSLLRYLLSFLNHDLFFAGTFLVNIAASFLLGIFTALFWGKKVTKDKMLFYGTGLCGGFSTMSAFAKEVNELLAVNLPAALAYAVAGALLGTAAGIGGLTLVSRWGR